MMLLVMKMPTPKSSCDVKANKNILLFNPKDKWILNLNEDSISLVTK